jgi:predicted DNA-binding transcriptional regulator AlpA
MRRLLKIRDVADLTGVGYNTVIQWVKAGLPTIRPVGRRSHLMDPSDLEAFLQQHKTSRVPTGVREISVTRMGTKIGTKNECQDGELRDNEVIPWYAKYR